MKHLCALPFMQVATKTSGRLRLCCHSPNSDLEPAMFLGKDSISEAWNSPFYREVRLKMISGEKHPACRSCHEDEDRGLRSRRQEANATWKSAEAELAARIEEAETNEGFVTPLPLGLDLRLGNTCNLKCKMCNPMTSRPFREEWSSLRERLDPDRYPSIEASYTGSKKMVSWESSSAFLQDLESVIPSVRRIYFAGGEPMLLPEVLGTLERIPLAKRSQVAPVINTNVTLYRESFARLLESYSRAVVVLSLDGFGLVNDYVRYPSRWETIERVVHSWFSHKLTFSICITIHALNGAHLLPLLEWLKSQPVDFDVDFNFVSNPSHLRFEILPEQKRLTIFSELMSWYETLDERNKRRFVSLPASKPHFTRTRVTDQDQLLIDYVREQDKQRTLSFDRVFGHPIEDLLR